MAILDQSDSKIILNSLRYRLFASRMNHRPLNKMGKLDLALLYSVHPDAEMAAGMVGANTVEQTKVSIEKSCEC